MRVELAAVLAYLWLAGCAHAPAGARGAAIDAEGWAPLGSEGRAHARDRALADALRRAVEARTGVRVEARSEVRGSVSLRQEVRTRSRGSVASWRMLDERDEGGLLRLRVRAVVLDAGDAPGKAVSLSIGDDRLAAGVARALTERGVAVEDGAFTKVAGSARSVTLGAAAFPGTETMRASAELVVSAHGVPPQRVFGAASALDADPRAAAERAIEAAGYKAGLALADELLR